ncbi:hypothetical protein A2526_03965 [candidate division WOR-1 bacterium RIFOXYD2_FULL_36_8]|uniref:DUF6985 domain-containing protein n=1 Tax=candidate division WOR-1 bacterium RIFOXYB2_FULL_36_35 TaxID=1802578 RepID=A0A1F4RZ97_UNCSA|nr:MAG: hypothetical protein A2230_01905 [candidate division WOR-1 bacterium RIFOXYA2_FULL_36_21]OGC13477.1 MAG: hypothetical protein A2290_07295 [candidate division WOR-1 bacterium RIFOXYB2_FULL_36_35]OGC15036.1 MAG: hypothetical protein A2282_00805 [candidate division WOR-1 bacterium RIFOXYA12_FULL_36_13]OGC39404.1 MAG: hypothetical protein A2526_03965 [candidate division WOR-1 bacterium RIFOXYD2_FULL_36_8]
MDEELILKTKFKSFNKKVEILFCDTAGSPNKIQQKTYDGFIEKQDALAADMLQKIFKFYKQSYSDYEAGWKAGGMSGKKLEKFLPKPTTAEALKSFITPATIYIQNKAKCKEGTLSIEFDCTWDTENGLGVLVENWRVVDVGHAEIAYF